MNFVPKQAEDLILEKQLKFVKQRFDEAEDEMAAMCSAFSEFCKRSAKYRDSTDQIATTAHKYATKEQINLSLKKCMECFAESMAQMGDHRDHSTEFLEDEVMTSLTQYANLSRKSQAQIKEIAAAKEREVSKRRQLTKIRQRFPQNVKIIMKAEVDLVEAASRVARMQSALEEYALAFEKTRLDDVKRILHDYLKAELAFHAGAIGSITEAARAVAELNVEADCQAFKSVLSRPNVAVRLDVVQNHCRLGCGVGGGIPLSSGQEDVGDSEAVAESNSRVTETSQSAESSKRITAISSEQSADGSESIPGGLAPRRNVIGAGSRGDSSEDVDDDDLYVDETSDSVIYVKPTVANV